LEAPVTVQGGAAGKCWTYAGGGGRARAEGGAVPCRERCGGVSMREYTFAPSLFCKTGKEEFVARGIEESGHGRALFPQRMKKFRKGQSWEERLTTLLPGYVFVYSDEELVRFTGFPSAQHIIRVLKYGNGGDAL